MVDLPVNSFIRVYCPLWGLTGQSCALSKYVPVASIRAIWYVHYHCFNNWRRDWSTSTPLLWCSAEKFLHFIGNRWCNKNATDKYWRCLSSYACTRTSICTCTYICRPWNIGWEKVRDKQTDIKLFNFLFCLFSIPQPANYHAYCWKNAQLSHQVIGNGLQTLQTYWV